MPDRPELAQALLPRRTEDASRGKPFRATPSTACHANLNPKQGEKQGKPYTYPQPTTKTSASTPGSLFNRRSGSVLLRRAQALRDIGVHAVPLRRVKQR